MFVCVLNFNVKPKKKEKKGEITHFISKQIRINVTPWDVILILYFANWVIRNICRSLTHLIFDQINSNYNIFCIFKSEIFRSWHANLKEKSHLVTTEITDKNMKKYQIKYDDYDF